MRRQAFTMVEILVVMVMISCGLLPIFSLIHASNKQVIDADARVLATIYGSSATEIIKTIGYNKIVNSSGEVNVSAITGDEDFSNLAAEMDESGYEMSDPIVESAQIGNGKESILSVVVKIRPKQTLGKNKDQIIPLSFMVLLTDPRATTY